MNTTDMIPVSPDLLRRCRDELDQIAKIRPGGSRVQILVADIDAALNAGAVAEAKAILLQVMSFRKGLYTEEWVGRFCDEVAPQFTDLLRKRDERLRAISAK